MKRNVRLSNETDLISRSMRNRCQAEGHWPRALSIYQNCQWFVLIPAPNREMSESHHRSCQRGGRLMRVARSRFYLETWNTAWVPSYRLVAGLVGAVSLGREPDGKFYLRVHCPNHLD
jgi:hypothetical protein